MRQTSGFLTRESDISTVTIDAPPSFEYALSAINIPKNSSNSFIFLPIELYTEKTTPTTVTALIDSGSQDNFIDKKYIKEHGLIEQPLDQPIILRYADGSTPPEATVRSVTNLDTIINGQPCEIRTLVTKLKGKDIILGTPFLEQHNPDIDWKERTFTWRNEKFPELLRSMNRPADKSNFALNYLITMSENLISETEWTNNPTEYYTPPENLEEYSITEEVNRIIATPLELNYKTTTAGELASKRQKISSDIPNKFRMYSKVFSEKESTRFPPSRIYDHKIDLKDSFKPISFKPYKLNPKETQELKTFIDENLKRGYIRESESPMASPFFFVGKKDGKLRPCQDYRYLNEHTIKNAYPIPLITTIMDKLEGAKYFTKLDIRQGYNNIRIHDGDQWKAAFKTPFGLFEPTVMFFGMTNSPATFQHMMNTIFAKMIDKNQIVVYMDDILIFSPTLKELNQRTHQVLQTLQENDLYLKPEKCEFEKQ